MVRSAFFEGEAELSGSEEPSDDEDDGDELDQMDEEEADREQLDEGKLRQQVRGCSPQRRRRCPNAGHCLPFLFSSCAVLCFRRELAVRAIAEGLPMTEVAAGQGMHYAADPQLRWPRWINPRNLGRDRARHGVCRRICGDVSPPRGTVQSAAG